MNHYRLYYLDQNNRHIIDVDDFRADSDALAIIQAGEPQDGAMRELWNGARRILELAR